MRCMLRRLASDCRGASAIEFAFILPVLVLIYMGTVDLANMLSADRKVSLTTSTIGDLVAQAPSIDTSTLNGFYDAADAIMAPFPTAEVQIEIFSFERDGNKAPKLAWQSRSNGGAPGCGGVPTIDPGLVAPNGSLITARVCYAYQPILGYVLDDASITLSDIFYTRPRRTEKIACADC